MCGQFSQPAYGILDLLIRAQAGKRKLLVRDGREFKTAFKTALHALRETPGAVVRGHRKMDGKPEPGRTAPGSRIFRAGDAILLNPERTIFVPPFFTPI